LIQVEIYRTLIKLEIRDDKELKVVTSMSYRIYKLFEDERFLLEKSSHMH